jgi:hypothetical protein
MLTTLAGCATFSAGRDEHVASLSPVPRDLRSCFNKLTPMPPEGALSKGETIKLIATLRKSEVAKSQCGKRLIAFYEAHI